MNAVIHDGEFTVAHSVIYPPQSFYYYNDIIKYNYDLDASFEWLDAAGYPISYGFNYFYPTGWEIFGVLLLSFVLPIIGITPLAIVVVQIAKWRRAKRK